MEKYEEGRNNRHRFFCPYWYPCHAWLLEKDKQEKTVKEWLGPVNTAVEEKLKDAQEIFFPGWSAPETDEDLLQLLRETLVNCQHAYVVNRVTQIDDVRNLMGRFYDISAGRFPITLYLGQTLGD